MNIGRAFIPSRTLIALIVLAFALLGCNLRPQTDPTLLPLSPTAESVLPPPMLLLTPTPLLSPSAPTQVALLEPAASASAAPAFIRPDVPRLFLYIAPDATSTRLTALYPYTPLEILGRSPDSAWLRVRLLDTSTGWLEAGALSLDPTGFIITDLALRGEKAPPPPPPTPYDELALKNITPRARQILEAGQTLENRPYAFAKIGDSLTANGWFLSPFAGTDYQLGKYASLQEVLAYFQQDGDSFGRVSLAAKRGWTSADLLDPLKADAGQCLGGETPLECEYRVFQPALALISIGTNDASSLTVAQYTANVGRITTLSLQRGVLPIFATLPPRRGKEAQIAEFNRVLVNLAELYGLPFWDYAGALASLPNHGLSSDGVHPSVPPEGHAAAAIFTPANLSYGATQRNLTALQALQILWLKVYEG